MPKHFFGNASRPKKDYLNFGWSHAKCCKLVGFHGCLLFLGSYPSTPKGRSSVECTLFNCRIQRAIFETPERELSQRQRQRLLRLAEQQDLNQQRAFWEEQDVRWGRNSSEEVERISILPHKLWNIIAVVPCCSYVTHTSSIFSSNMCVFRHETCIYTPIWYDYITYSILRQKKLVKNDMLKNPSQSSLLPLKSFSARCGCGALGA